MPFRRRSFFIERQSFLLEDLREVVGNLGFRSARSIVGPWSEIGLSPRSFRHLSQELRAAPHEIGLVARHAHQVQA
jgi:hypothetical protein